MRSFMMFGLICAAERLFGAAAKQQVETGSGGKGYGGKFGVVPRVIRIDGKMVKDKRMEHKYFQIYGFEPQQRFGGDYPGECAAAESEHIYHRQCQQDEKQAVCRAAQGITGGKIQAGKQCFQKGRGSKGQALPQNSV